MRADGGPRRGEASACGDIGAREAKRCAHQHQPFFVGGEQRVAVHVEVAGDGRACGRFVCAHVGRRALHTSRTALVGKLRG